MMHMTFYWSREVTLLLNSWRTHSWPAYLLTLLACLLAAAFYQYMEHLRLRIRIHQQPPIQSQSQSQSQAPLLPKRLPGGRTAGGALLFGVNAALGYLLMLAVMSYNGGVFVAVVLGLAIGFFLFRSADQDVLDNNPCACA